MDRTCFALPLLAGKAAAARAFLRELEGEHTPAYAASERRLGITKEVWALQTLPGGAAFVVYIEAPDVGEAFRRFAASPDGFDRWFKDRVREITGADLNVPPAGPMSDVLSVYEAAAGTSAPPMTAPAGGGPG
jgi:hypothetical protein